MNSTEQQYDAAVRSCREIFIKKARDYGVSWRVMRTISITDQVFIKAQRIRNIQQIGKQKVGDDLKGEFQAMVNYAIMGLILLDLEKELSEDPSLEKVENWYDHVVKKTKKIMLDKNHDYGEAWREMSQEGFVDLIMMKLLRIRQILSNDGKTLVSEGIDSNFIDIINYSVFALILIEEGKHKG